MSLLRNFLTRFNNTLTDEAKHAKDNSFIDLVVLLERNVKRSLGAQELIVVYSLDDRQTETLTKLMKEANRG